MFLWWNRRMAGLVAVLTLAAMLIAVGPAGAATLVVDTTADTADAAPGDGFCDDGTGACSLRAAIMEANATVGADTVTLPAGTYALTRAGADENAAATGDLDITDDLTVTGAGSSVTVVDADSLDRVVHVAAEVLASISGVTFTNGDLDQSTGLPAMGAGMLNEGTLSLTGVKVTAGRVATTSEPSFGGGIASTGSLRVTDSEISANRATAAGNGALGGGIYHTGPATITTTTVDGNTAKGSLGTLPIRGALGGGIYSEGPLEFSDGTISGNEAFDDVFQQARALGGGIYAVANVTVVRSTIDGNQVNANEGNTSLGSSAARGGAVAISGVGNKLSLVRSTISNNSADIEDDATGPLFGTARGGGIFTEQLAAVDVKNSTISGNSAESGGGGLYHSGSDATLINATVTGNATSTGGGIAGSGTTRMWNSIVAGNTATVGADCKGSIKSDGYSLLGSSSDCTLTGAASTSIQHRDPVLGPLADNGGPTLTHAVLDGSPAAGTGSPLEPGSGGLACEPVDQRGEPRPAGARCDMGAFESSFATSVPYDVGADYNGDGFMDVAVGVPGEAVSGALNAGLVNVQYGSSGGLGGQGISLTQDSPGAKDRSELGDAFGSQVVAGDFNGDGFDDLAVGVPGEKLPGANKAGMVHVFYGSDAGLATTGDQTIHFGLADIPGEAATGQFLGTSLAAGDFDGDGIEDLAMGAPGTAVLERRKAGAVLVVHGSPTGLDLATGVRWTQGADGLSGSPQRDDQFGSALSSGDYNGDGRFDLAIGAPGEQLGGVDAGIVQVLYGSSNGLTTAGQNAWHQGKKALVGDNQDGDRYGAALASGDLDGDGYHELVVGVPGELLNGFDDVGRVHVLPGSAKGLSGKGDVQWHQGKAGIPEGNEAGDLLGSSLVIRDFNGDGHPDLAAGAPGEELSGKQAAGMVLAIYGSAAGLVADGAQSWHDGSDALPGAVKRNDEFGAAVTGGDYNGDGKAELIVGVPGQEVANLSNAGSVVMIRGGSTGLTSVGGAVIDQNSTGVDDVAEANDRFGMAAG